MVPERQAFHPSQKAVKAVADSTVSRPRRSRAKYRDNKTVEVKPAQPARKRRRSTRMDSLSDSKASDGSDFCLEVPASRGLEVSRSHGSDVPVTQKAQDPKSQSPGELMIPAPQDPKSQGSDDPGSQDSSDTLTQISPDHVSLNSHDPMTLGSGQPVTVQSMSQDSELLASESKQVKDGEIQVNRLPKRQPKQSATKLNPTEELSFHSTNDATHSNGSSERLLMRQWLESEADGGKNPGLKWLDKKEGLIRINWRHGSRAEWSTSDVTVFKCWAQHTGRYSSVDPDYKRWKANFRCAVNSLQDVTEIKEKRSTKTGDPFKVYKLLPAVPPKKRRRESVKSARSSSPENVPLVTEVSMATDITATEPMEPEPLLVDPLSQELFLQLMPLPSIGCESVVTWSSSADLDCITTSEDVDNFVTLDMPLMRLDHCYANTTDAVAQIQPSLLPPPPTPPPPPPPPPAPFNDAIPLPVQNLIDSSEEFQTMTSASDVNFESLNVGELLSFADVNVSSVSPANDNSVLLLDALLQHFTKCFKISVAMELFGGSCGDAGGGDGTGDAGGTVGGMTALMNQSGIIISHEAV